MKLIDGKSILLGMGMGIIMTSILGFIFFMGYEPQDSDKEIIDKAKRLGMTDKFASEGDFVRNQDGSLTLTIKEGEDSSSVSDKLYNAGIISSSIEFDIMIKKQNLQNAIIPGQYRIDFQDDIKTIINKITKNETP